MKLVNAEIKTAEELAQRILNKEKLFNEEGGELEFNPGNALDTPWQSVRVVDCTSIGDSTKKFSQAVSPMENEWHEPQTIQRLAEWHEQTDSLVPCKVWDNGETEHDNKRIRMVIPCKKHHPSGAQYFETHDHNQWHNAIPLTEADLFKAE